MCSMPRSLYYDEKLLMVHEAPIPSVAVHFSLQSTSRTWAREGEFPHVLAEEAGLPTGCLGVGLPWSQAGLEGSVGRFVRQE